MPRTNDMKWLPPTRVRTRPVTTGGFPPVDTARKSRRIKKSSFTGEQIVAALKQGEAGVKTAGICHQNGISGATFY
jgi:hypothetical protein